MKAHDLPEGRETKPFLEHLADLRRMLMRGLLALGLGMAVAFPATPQIIRLLKAPLLGLVSEPDVFLKSIEVGGAFGIAMRVCLWSGLLISAPFLVFFIGQFIFPGLTRREQRVILRSAGFAVVLFAVGVCLGYYVTLPVAIRLMLQIHEWLGVTAEWTISSYVAFAIQLLLAFGLTFELPLVILILGRLGLVTAAQLREKRKHAIVIILIIAMFMTPPDVFTQLIMGLPLILLYELCVWLTYLTEKKSASARP